jgi:ferredoxin-NADP reductase
VKYLQGGAASEYLSRLKIGDPVEIWGPYGDFTYETDSSRSVCFIATGTGIAPIRSIVLSEKFRNEPPRKATLLFGARDSTEIVYPGAFEEAGCRVIYALSQFKGPHTHGPMAEVYGRRLTDYLESLPKYSNWQNTDFYLCGNNEMIMDVTSILIQAFNVDSEAIRSEAFGASIQSLPINRVKRVA